jgi:predicted enzyme related to lactoylglutathione lyase
VDDIAAEAAQLRARGAHIQHPPETGTAGIGFALAAWFTDPHHNPIGLLQLT